MANVHKCKTERISSYANCIVMDDLTSDSQLVRDLVEFCGLAPAALAKKAGVAPSTVSRPYTGTATTRLGRSVLSKLQDAFPDFPGWSGKAVPQGSLVLRSNVRIPKPFPDEDVVDLPEIDLRYGMGETYLDMPVTAERRRFSRAWLRNFTHASPDQLFWASGDGDSMEPTIRAGETFLIDTSQRSPRMSDGIWAMAVGDIGMVKRIAWISNGMIELHSDNPHAPKRPPVSESELHIIGRVVAVVRKL